MIRDDILAGRNAQQALLRLEARARLSSIAIEMFQGIRNADDRAASNTSWQSWTTGEADTIYFCDKSTTGKGVQHDCSDFQCKQAAEGDGFDCGRQQGNFTCDPNNMYGGCRGQAGGSFDCKGATIFNCTDSNNVDANVYSCQKFTCTNGELSGFSCTATFDFFCTDLYECKNRFQCIGNHIFLCSDDHGCAADTFTCKAGENAGCTTENPYTCTKDDTAPYNNPIAPPGDFMCGFFAGDADSFNCQNKFDCKGLSDFVCDKSATFQCGDANGTDSFECTQTATNTFLCDKDNYTCGAGAAADFAFTTPDPWPEGYP